MSRPEVVAAWEGYEVAGQSGEDVQAAVGVGDLRAAEVVPWSAVVETVGVQVMARRLWAAAPPVR